MRTRARSLLLGEFSKSFFGFLNRTVKRKSKSIYLSDEIRFRILRSIANPKSGFSNPILDLPIERTPELIQNDLITLDDKIKEITGKGLQKDS